MNTSDQKLVELLARLMHEYAYELDSNYENDDIAIFANADNSFLSFRAGLRALREHSGTLTGLVLHMERRIEMAYRKGHNEPLPPLEDEPLPPVRPDEDIDNDL
jgi:hypothetical protein